MSKVMRRPNAGGYQGNFCAFCKRWEGDAGIVSGKARGQVLLDPDAKGKCLKTRSTRKSLNGACRDFEMDYNVSRYV